MQEGGVRFLDASLLIAASHAYPDDSKFKKQHYQKVTMACWNVPATMCC